jgi:hypothetical protein
VGGVAPFAVGGGLPNVAASYDPSSGALVLSGRVPGRTVVTVTDASGAGASLDVLVAPAAGNVPTDVTVELAGRVSPGFAADRIAGAIGREAQLQPGATIQVSGVTVPALMQAPDELEAVARVHLGGGGRFVDVDGTTNVHLRVDALDRLLPQFLFYSDDPEKIPSGDQGVLYRGRVDAGHPARLYAYHVAEGAGTRLYLALRPESGSARVQVLGYAAGPTDAYGYAGHVATLQYLLERNSQESAVLEVLADAPLLRPLGYRPLNPGDLVTVIFDLRVLEGAPVEVAVVAAAADADPGPLLAGPVLPGDGHGRTGIYALGDIPPLALAYAAGAPDPPSFVVGDDGLPNLVPGGRALAGDYGVVRPVALQLSNPAPTPASVYLYETPIGGSATTTIWFDGDPQPTQVGCVRPPGTRYLVKEFDLAPNETRAVTGSYMTDGASSFPLSFGLTSVPPSAPPDPSAPGGCNSRT